ncbi:MAG TPA: dTDP-4-dehydrorhamnose reductase [Candidatus Dormibacteraeota bacterium]|nr:dTDP-4-dehydrorhamnose reductase [Candidatus Dormibacteraeota bacterium]
MRVLVLGAGGQVGAELARQAAERGDEVMAVGHAEVDIRDGYRVRELVRWFTPEVCFNAAAYTAVDRAESEPELAEEVNHLAARRVAEICRDMVVRLVHYSTDYVFDGTATVPIPEHAPTSPLGVYGRTKLAGEAAVLRSGAEAWVVRTAWVYGLEGHNFVRTVLRLGRERGELRVVDDQRGSPTWARDLAAASLRLAGGGGPAGVCHLTNAGAATWYEVAVEVARLAGLDTRVLPIATAEYPTPARRPAYSVLDNARWRALGWTPLRPWREALAEFVPLLLARG